MVTGVATSVTTVEYVKDLLHKLVIPGRHSTSGNWASVVEDLEAQAHGHSTEALDALTLVASLFFFGLPQEHDGKCAFPAGVPRNHTRAAELIILGLQRGGCGRCHLLLGLALSIQLPMAHIVAASNATSALYQDRVGLLHERQLALRCAWVGGKGKPLFARLDRPVVAYDAAALSDPLGGIAAGNVLMSGLRASPQHLRLRDPPFMGQPVMWEAKIEPLLWRSPRELDADMARERCEMAFPLFHQSGDGAIEAEESQLVGLQSAWLVQKFLPDTGLAKLQNTEPWAAFVLADTTTSSRHLGEAALLHFHGDEDSGTQRNSSRALELWSQAAQVGDDFSAFNAMIVAARDPRSEDWAQLALQGKKLRPSQLARAEAHLNRNNTVAWAGAMRRAADLGDPDAALHLAEVLYGVEGSRRRDEVSEALSRVPSVISELMLKWYNFAAKQGRLRGFQGLVNLHKQQGLGDNACSAALLAMQLGHNHPDSVMLMALAKRSLRLKDYDGASLRFALASELGIKHAHIAAAALWELQASKRLPDERRGLRNIAARYHDRALRAGHTWSAHRLLGLVESSWALAALDFAAKLGDIWAEAEAAILAVRMNVTSGRERIHAILSRNSLPWLLRARARAWSFRIFIDEHDWCVAAIACLLLLAMACCTAGLIMRRQQCLLGQRAA